MFTTVEIERTNAISSYYAPSTKPFVVAACLFYGNNNELVADFWTTTFGVTEEVKAKTFITGVTYGYQISYSKKNTYSEMLNDFESYFWDTLNQVLSIKLNVLHNLNWITPNMQYGIAINLCKDKVREIGDREFLPLLTKLEPITRSVDKINFDQLSLLVANITLNNVSGFFDEFKESPIYGNLVHIKTGNDGDDYDSLVLRNTCYIEDYDFSAKEMLVEIQDIRKAQARQIPYKLFTAEEYPNIADNLIGGHVPFAYGAVKLAPGFCVNEKEVDADTYPVFIFAEILGSDTITVYCQVDDTWIPQTGVTVDLLTGQVTVPGARVSQSATEFSIRAVRADIEGYANTHASDIIKDINDRFLGITYDATNYDITAWEAAETILEPIGFYISEFDYTYNYILKLQSYSNVNFKYDISKGRRNILIDNPNKAIAYEIGAQDIFNTASVLADSNKADMFNIINVGFNYGIATGIAEKTLNIDNYDASFAAYKITNTYDKNTGLVSAILAENKARLLNEELSFIHRLFELRIYGFDYLNINLLDIVNATIDVELLKIEAREILVDSLTADDSYTAQASAVLTLTGMLDFYNIVDIGKKLFGVIRGQVISVKPDYDLGFNTIIIKERPLSEVWEELYE